jgi:hypothetical protein
VVQISASDAAGAICLNVQSEAAVPPTDCKWTVVHAQAAEIARNTPNVDGTSSMRREISSASTRQGGMR